MNNLKKVGLSALAGSLAMFSAHAGEMTISGSAEATYTSNSGSDALTTLNGTGGLSGNPFGLSHDIDITGTGELDNGWTYKVNTDFAQDMAQDSTTLMLDMGSLGTVGIDQGSGAFGIGTLENKVPTAYEEADHGVGVLGHGIDAGGDTKVIGYSNTIQGVGISVEIDRDTTNEVYAQAGSSSLNATGSLATGHGRGVNYAITYAVPGFDGLTLAAGASSIKYQTDLTDEEDTMAVNYSFGPISAGYQLSNVHPRNSASNQEIEAMGVAFNVNDQLSVSYSKNDNEQAGVTEESTGFQAAYSMGSASVRIAFNEANNVNGVAAVESENTEISLSLAF